VKSEVVENTVVTTVDSLEKKNLRGLSRTLISNMVV
jgi:ribosomal protein L6P/L9E